MDSAAAPSNRHMSRRALLLASTLALAATVSTVAGAALSTAAGENTAQFSASGPAGLSIVGKNAGSVTLREEGDNLLVVVALESLDTGISLRNKHMREKYLETSKYPNAVLSVPSASISRPTTGKVSANASGTMTIHGKSAPVTFHYDAVNDGGVYRVTGSVPLDIRAFGIEIPSYLGVTVKPNITAEVKFSAHDR